MHKIVLLTADQRRHKYVANRIHNAVGLSGILSEKKRSQTNNSDGDQIIAAHFNRREKVESEMLGDNDFPNNVPILNKHDLDVNSAEAFDWIKRLSPDLILLYGTRIIRQKLLTAFDQKIINMHLGLSPYYRGSGTNFWPLVEGCPEFVGATIHVATARVDAGGILHQVRPSIEKGDRCHEIGTKSIIEGSALMASAATEYLNYSIKPMEQDLSMGKVFKKKDFRADSVTRMDRNFNAGMVQSFLENRESVCSKVPLVQQLN